MNIKLYQKEITEPQTFDSLCWNTFFIVESDITNLTKATVFMVVPLCERQGQDETYKINAVCISRNSNNVMPFMFFQNSQKIYVVEIIDIIINPLI